MVALASTPGKRLIVRFDRGWGWEWQREGAAKE